MNVLLYCVYITLHAGFVTQIFEILLESGLLLGCMFFLYGYYASSMECLPHTSGFSLISYSLLVSITVWNCINSFTAFLIFIVPYLPTVYPIVHVNFSTFMLSHSSQKCFCTVKYPYWRLTLNLFLLKSNLFYYKLYKIRYEIILILRLLCVVYTVYLKCTDTIIFLAGLIVLGAGRLLCGIAEVWSIAVHVSDLLVNTSSSA